MGFFKKVKKRVKKTVKAVVSRAPRVGTAVVTGGGSEVLRLAGQKGISEQLESTFFPTSLSDVSQTVATVAPFLGGGPAPVGSTGGVPMGGNFLGGLGGIFKSLSGIPGPIGQVSQVGSGFLSGFLPAQGPVGNVPSFGGVQAQPVMGARPLIQGTAGALKELIAPVLEKLSFNLGKNISLRAAMIIIRRLGKFLTSPTAIAVALGLTLNELGQILTSASLAGSGGRRMNASNPKALRRAHRRIRSFHKLCQDNDQLMKPRRRSSPRKTILVNAKTCA